MKNLIRAFAFLSFIFLVLFVTACDSSAAKVERQKSDEYVEMPQLNSDKPKIIAFGDSLTAGFGLAEKEAYPYLLQGKLKADGYDYEVTLQRCPKTIWRL